MYGGRTGAYMAEWLRVRSFSATASVSRRTTLCETSRSRTSGSPSTSLATAPPQVSTWRIQIELRIAN
eukprot:2944231-Rhodomonas_salina.1